MTNLIVTAENLNLRANPNVDSDVIDVLSKDDVVELLDVSEDKYWKKIKTSDSEIGWASHKYLRDKLKELPVEIASESKSNFPWFEIAIHEIGVKEIVGAVDNPRVVEYLHSTSLSATYASQDETPWCSAFVNWCVEKSGYEGTDSAWARSWLKWGRSTVSPVTGCIVVFERGVSSGHVALFVSKTDTSIKVLGGNQHNSVCIADYPIDRLLGYRIPK